METAIYIIGVLIIVGFVEYKNRKIAQKIEKANNEILDTMRWYDDMNTKERNFVAKKIIELIKPSADSIQIVDKNGEIEIYKNLKK